MTAIMSIQTSYIHAEQAGNTAVYPDSTSSYHDGDIQESIVESIEEPIVESIEESIVESIEERSLFCVGY